MLHFKILHHSQKNECGVTNRYSELAYQYLHVHEKANT